MNGSTASCQVLRLAPSFRFPWIRIIVLLLFSGSLPPWIQAGTVTDLANGNLGFEERVQCRRAIEEVYWRHRIWPAANPAPKPTLDELRSDRAIRESVTTQIRTSAALGSVWSRPLTGDQLQAELDRMVRDSRQPGLLRELFAALDDDPLLAAECLARPVLVDRLVRNWYARDSRFHDAVREEAETAIASYPDRVSRLSDLGGEYRETVWRLVPEERPGTVPEINRAATPVIQLTPEEWHRNVARLQTLFDAETEPVGVDGSSAPLARIPLRVLSRIVEENGRFVATALLSGEPDRVRVATLTWSKRPFEAWWTEDGVTLIRSIAETTPVYPPSGGYRLRSPVGTACDLDSWFGGWELPEGRSFHSAVWTGTEMIVWGGNGGSRRLHTGGRYTPATDSWRATSTGPGTPEARRQHTAVWTGTEMIVWGGYGGSPEDQLNTGGRYDPVHDRWSATSMMTGVPQKRRDHTAVWTGSEMIVFGGYDDGASLFTGARYDPETDRWTSIPKSHWREEHTAVWTGTEMIVWGGYPYSIAIGARYDPVADSWTSIHTVANSGLPRRQHTAVWTGSEMIVWGGRKDMFYETGIRYDPVADSWTEIATGQDVPMARAEHTAIWTGSEMIVWGGNHGDTRLNTGGRYDPSTDSWAPTSTEGAVPTARTAHTGVWTGTEMIVWGGYGGGQQNTGGRYEPDSDSWTATSTEPGAPTARSGHAAVWSGTEMIVWGGYGSGGYPDDGGRYDPVLNTWSQTSMGPGVPAGRAALSAVWTGTELIVWGGEQIDGGLVYTNTGGRYDPFTDRWSPTSTGQGVPTGRRYSTAVWNGTEMIVWGGHDGEGYPSSGGRYDPADDRWSPVSSGPGAPAGRQQAAGVWTGTEMIVWGGHDGSDPLSTGGRYDSANDLWAATNADTGVPEARHYHTAVWTGSEMIVWGGRNLDFLNSGGRYDPSSDSWSATPAGTDVPEERYLHEAVWTGVEMIVWGGSRYEDQWAFLNSGGRYDPVSDSWAATSIPYGQPIERQDHTAVWTGTEMIVWGGYNGQEHLESVGSYCACDAGVNVNFWYADSDGDGYGSDSTGVFSCSQPAGYVELGGDCDDGNPDTFSGAAEINDGLDNQCPGDLGHGLVDEITGSLGFFNAADTNELSWPAQSGATAYAVARSTVPQFTGDCVVTQTAATLWIDTDPVPDGVGFHYLVRALLPNSGSWGADSDGMDRAGVCP